MDAILRTIASMGKMVGRSLLLASILQIAYHSTPDPVEYRLMRLPEASIKQGVLHPEQLVRDMAVRYFAVSFIDDPYVMPLAIQAVETYGWDDAFRACSSMGELAQTEDTLLWFMDQLNRMGHPTNPKEAEHCEQLSSIIARSDISLLMKHEQDILGLEGFSSGCREAMSERLGLMTVDTESCWRELEHFCEEAKGKHYSHEVNLSHAYRLVEAIGRDEDCAEKVLTILSQRLDNYENLPMAWMEPFAARIAAEMRLESAIPLVAAKLREDGGTFLDEQCLRCFVKVGTDAAVKTICQNWAAESRHYRLFASAALKNIRSDFVVAQCLDLAQREESREIKANLIGAALHNFSTEGIEPARQYTAYVGLELRAGLTAVSILTEVDFPEREQWLKAERHNAQNRKAQYEESGLSVRATARNRAQDLSLDRAVSPPVTPPIVRNERVGRNDPCPCKSGKKYKKCCGKNG